MYFGEFPTWRKISLTFSFQQLSVMFTWTSLENTSTAKLRNVRKCKNCTYITKCPLVIHRHLSSKPFKCTEKRLSTYQCQKNCHFKTNFLVFLKQHLKDYHKTGIKDYDQLPRYEFKLRNFSCHKCTFRTYSLLHFYKHRKKDCQYSLATIPRQKRAPRQVKFHQCDHCACATKR